MGEYGRGGNGQFYSPSAVAIDGAGHVYVVDRGNSRIQKCSPEGTFLAKWGSEGRGDGQFAFGGFFGYGIVDPGQAGGIAVDQVGNVYVADDVSGRIQKFSSEGTFLAQWGSQGTGDGQFEYPIGVAVDAAGHVYVTERDNHRIQKFSPEGAFLAQWGSQGGGDGQFLLPTAVAVDAAGDVYVAGDRIRKFSSEGAFLVEGGSMGRAVAVDAAGNVYVAGDRRIQKFSASGRFLTQWGRAGSGGDHYFSPKA